ncbi:MAG: hypothetical protein ABIJ91_01710 [Candidatus Kuenenbacteria bacterium]
MKSKIHKLYRAVSLLSQIPILTAILILLLLKFGKLDYQDLHWIVITLINLSFFPLIYGFSLYLNHNVSDENIMIRKERIMPFFVVTAIYGINFILAITLGAPKILQIIAVNYFLLSIILSIITIFWKISAHVAGMTIFIALSAILINYQALFFSPLIFLVAWVRIKIESHNFWQVVSGGILAIIIIYLTINMNL